MNKPNRWVIWFHGRRSPCVWFPLRDLHYTADHDPAHIHITGPGQAKINLYGADGRPELVSVVGIKSSDMRRLMAEVSDRRGEFLQEWERIHGKPD